MIPGRVAGSFEKRIRQADLDDFTRALAGDRPGEQRQQIGKARSAEPKSRRRGRSDQPQTLADLVQERLGRHRAGG
jgi:hypothetical protein